MQNSVFADALLVLEWQAISDVNKAARCKAKAGFNKPRLNTI